MCCIATIRRPLRSKRATISPVRPRANASGLTRINVRSMGGECVSDACGATRRRWRPPRARTPRCPSARRWPPSPGRWSAGGAGARWTAWRVRLRLAERAHAPGRVDRLAARVAALLELAHAARAAQGGRVDLVVAVRGEVVGERGE